MLSCNNFYIHLFITKTFHIYTILYKLATNKIKKNNKVTYVQSGHAVCYFVAVYRSGSLPLRHLAGNSCCSGCCFSRIVQRFCHEHLATANFPPSSKSCRAPESQSCLHCRHRMMNMKIPYKSHQLSHETSALTLRDIFPALSAEDKLMIRKICHH